MRKQKIQKQFAREKTGKIEPVKIKAGLPAVVSSQAEEKYFIFTEKDILNNTNAEFFTKIKKLIKARNDADEIRGKQPVNSEKEELIVLAFLASKIGDYDDDNEAMEGCLTALVRARGVSVKRMVRELLSSFPHEI